MGRPPRTTNRGRVKRRYPDKKFVAFLTGLMVWTVYCSFIAVYPEYKLPYATDDLTGMTLLSAMTTLAVWVVLVMPYIKYEKRTE